MDKGIVFFFPGKDWGVLTHSLWAIFVFFFRVLEKKNKLFFFFPGKVCMPLTQLRDGKLQKKVKNGKKRHLLSNFIFFSLFFFFPVKSCFFFSQEKFTRHSLTRFQRAGKKKQRRKKKTPFLLTHSKNTKKVQILIFSG